MFEDVQYVGYRGAEGTPGRCRLLLWHDDAPDTELACKRARAVGPYANALRFGVDSNQTTAAAADR